MFDSNKKKIELLAPAKDLDCGMAAVNFGADAVYIGYEKFGARSKVGNSLSNIEQMCNFAHKYWAKVYVAFNTILYDNELDEAEKLIHRFHEMGADGIIIQDMGILEMNLPPIPVIASTQAHNTSWQKVDFFEKTGFHRVILARELSLQQIKEIKSKTTIDLEAFVHGSLCVCYSGQCYMSQAWGGRSANRGECAQPCRLPYNLNDESGKVLVKDKHLLSLKDLNLSEHLLELLQAGITSLKIEGRLKDITYVKNVVAFYRQKLDDIFLETDFEKASSGTVKPNFIPDVNKSFNRGFSTYFLHQRSSDITSFDSPKSKGEWLGKVSKVFKNYFLAETPKQLNNGDGICFYFGDNQELTGTKINKVDGSNIFPDSMEHISAGLEIFRNFDIQFEAQVKNDKSKRKIQISLFYKARANGFELIAIDEDQIQATLFTEYKNTKIDNYEKFIETLNLQLAKTGDTVFQTHRIVIDEDNLFFVPIAIINEARRRLLDMLEEDRLKGYQRQEIEIHPNSYPFPDQDISYLNNVSNNYARNFYFRHKTQIVDQALELQKNIGKNTLMSMKHCLKFSYGECPKYHKVKDKSMSSSMVLQSGEKKFQIEFNCVNCEIQINSLVL